MLFYVNILLGDVMEPYKAKKLPITYEVNSSLIKLLCEAEEVYGEYKGYLRNMSYDYRYFLEAEFINSLYYSFKIDGAKINKEDIFFIPYMIKNNNTVQFENMKRILHFGSEEAYKDGISLNLFNKLNKILFNDCKKDSKTKNSGKLRKIQNYILKPGIAGSSVSFIPPVYSDLNTNMKNLVDYLTNNDDHPFIATAIGHYQFEKLHPYVSGNGKLGRIMIPITYSFYKKEPPILFMSESLEALKNTYFTQLSGEVDENINHFIKFFLQAIIDQCILNIKKIKRLNKLYKNEYDKIIKSVGGTTIEKVYPIMIKRIVFTTSDIVNDCNLHINSVNKVLNKMVEQGILIKEKRKGTNRVTFCYKSFYDAFIN